MRKLIWGSIVFLTVILLSCEKESTTTTDANYYTIQIGYTDTVNIFKILPSTEVSLYAGYDSYTKYYNKRIYKGTTDSKGILKVPQDSILKSTQLTDIEFDATNGYKLYFSGKSSMVAVYGTYLYLNKNIQANDTDTVQFTYSLFALLMKYNQWKYVKSYANNVLVSENLIPSCAKDNYISFSYYSTSNVLYVTYNDGTNVCTPSYSGTYAIGTTDKTLTYSKHMFSSELTFSYANQNSFGTYAKMELKKDTVIITGNFMSNNTQYSGSSYFVAVK